MAGTSYSSHSLAASSLLARSEEHTSELQSPCNLVCRLLLEKKKKVILYVFGVNPYNETCEFIMSNSLFFRDVFVERIPDKCVMQHITYIIRVTLRVSLTTAC